MQIEEAKDILRKDILIDDCFINHELDVIFKESTKVAIDTVLNYIEIMHKEFDRLEGIEDNTAMLKHELEKKDKVIDEILNKFIEGTGYYYSEFDYMSKEEIKEYFYKKVR